MLTGLPAFGGYGLSKGTGKQAFVGLDPLDSVKRKVYLAAITSGLPAVLLLWIASKPSDSSVTVTFPLFALVCLASIWALWSRAVPIRLVERVTFAGGAVFAFAHLSFALYGSEDLADARTTITEVSYLTLTALYVVAHLIFDRHAALRISLALYGASFALVLAKVLLDAPDGLSVENISWVLRMQSFMGAVIAFSHASSSVKDQMLRQMTEADTMRHLAHTDQLTGIANRRQIYSELRLEMEKARRYGRPLCAILFDLDHFKRINDTYGHDRGDAVLREVARITKPLLRKTDHLGRWGGEEFFILTPETSLVQANHLAERLRRSIEDHPLDFTPGVTASFGLAQYRPDETPETFVKRTDEALYKAKSLGRNRAESAA